MTEYRLLVKKKIEGQGFNAEEALKALEEADANNETVTPDDKEITAASKAKEAVRKIAEADRSGGKKG